MTQNDKRIGGSVMNSVQIQLIRVFMITRCLYYVGNAHLHLIIDGERSLHSINRKLMVDHFSFDGLLIMIEFIHKKNTSMEKKNTFI